jgi:hypothetical protein
LQIENGEYENIFRIRHSSQIVWRIPMNKIGAVKKLSADLLHTIKRISESISKLEEETTVNDLNLNDRSDFLLL